jgi:hypothetical protein
VSASAWSIISVVSGYILFKKLEPFFAREI